MRDHQVGFFILADEEPTIHRKKFIQFCEELVERNLPVLWGINTRVTDILRDEALLPLFRRACPADVQLMVAGSIWTAAEAEEALLAAYGALAAGPAESSPEALQVPADPNRIELQGELGSPSAKALAKAAKAAGHGASKVEIELRELQS